MIEDMKTIGLACMLLFLRCGASMAADIEKKFDVQVLVEKAKGGVVNLTISRTFEDGEAEAIFEVSGGTEDFKVFSRKDEVWVWTTKKGLLLYLVESDGGIKMVDPKKEKRPIPKAFVNGK